MSFHLLRIFMFSMILTVHGFVSQCLWSGNIKCWINRMKWRINRKTSWKNYKKMRLILMRRSMWWSPWNLRSISFKYPLSCKSSPGFKEVGYSECASKIWVRKTLGTCEEPFAQDPWNEKTNEFRSSLIEALMKMVLEYMLMLKMTLRMMKMILRNLWTPMNLENYLIFIRCLQRDISPFLGIVNMSYIFVFSQVRVKNVIRAISNCGAIYL